MHSYERVWPVVDVSGCSAHVRITPLGAHLPRTSLTHPTFTLLPPLYPPTLRIKSWLRAQARCTSTLCVAHCARRGASPSPALTPPPPLSPPPLAQGDAGAGLYTSWEPTPAWSAFHSAQFGHGEITFLNATNALWTWHRNADAEAKVMDEYMLVNTPM